MPPDNLEFNEIFDSNAWSVKKRWFSAIATARQERLVVRWVTIRDCRPNKGRWAAPPSLFYQQGLLYLSTSRGHAGSWARTDRRLCRSDMSIALWDVVYDDNRLSCLHLIEIALAAGTSLRWTLPPISDLSLVTGVYMCRVSKRIAEITLKFTEGRWQWRCWISLPITDL